MSKIKTIVIIFGGNSTEHEVSLQSATNIYHAINTQNLRPILLGMNKFGEWQYNDAYTKKNEVDLVNRDYFADAKPVFLEKANGKGGVFSLNEFKLLESFDVAFPIIHGNFGEDGKLQGLLEFLSVPYIGPNVLGSSVGMDKIITKRLLRDAGIPTAKDFVIKKHNITEFSFTQIVDALGLPLFVKPANAGSSVGVNKVATKEEYESAINVAMNYDNRVLVEEAVTGKEVECALMGNMDNYRASVLGEIVATKDFYSYEAKYLDAKGSIMKIPADLDSATSELIRSMGLKAFETLACEGISRIDFFVREDNSFVLNEINTLPGFTAISMYPKLWEATGINYSELIEKIVQLAIQRFQRDTLNKKSV